MGVWVISDRRERKGDKLLEVKLYNTVTQESMYITTSRLKYLMRIGDIQIENLVLDRRTSGGLRLVNLNPLKGKRGTDNYLSITKNMREVIRRYCIILGGNNGVYEYITDDVDGVTVHGFATIQELQYLLNSSRREIVFYNARRVMNNDGEMFIYTFNKDTGKYMYNQNTRKTFTDLANMRQKFGDGVIVDLDRIRKGVYSLKYLEHHGIYSLEIPEGIVEFKEFGGGVNKLVMPSTLRFLQPAIFSEEPDLIEVELNEGLEYIPNSAFEYTLIKEIKLPTTIKKVGDHAFNGCYKLRGPIYASGLEEVGFRSFSGTRINQLNLPKIRNIDNQAFEGCHHLEKVTLGDYVQFIGKGAFKNCTKLREVQVNKATIIEDGAFDRRVSVKRI